MTFEELEKFVAFLRQRSMYIMYESQDETSDGDWMFDYIDIGPEWLREIYLDFMKDEESYDTTELHQQFQSRS